MRVSLERFFYRNVVCLTEKRFILQKRRFIYRKACACAPKTLHVSPGFPGNGRALTVVWYFWAQHVLHMDDSASQLRNYPQHIRSLFAVSSVFCKPICSPGCVAKTLFAVRIVFYTYHTYMLVVSLSHEIIRPVEQALLFCMISKPVTGQAQVRRR